VTPIAPQILDTMKRATTFMVEKVSTNGGYRVDLSAGSLSSLGRAGSAQHADLDAAARAPRRWATLFLDAYHATGDEYYYAAAEKRLAR
jgi:hypothetical protein